VGQSTFVGGAGPAGAGELGALDAVAGGDTVGPFDVLVQPARIIASRQKMAAARIGPVCRPILSGPDGREAGRLSRAGRAR
jgi:hypothetical protein